MIALAYALIGTACGTRAPPPDAANMGQEAEAESAAAPLSAVSDAASQGLERHFSVAESELLRGLHGALSSPVAREAVRASVLLQVRRSPPIAVIDGHWASPVDLAALVRAAGIAAVADSASPLIALSRQARELLDQPHGLKQLAGLVFTAHDLRREIGLPYVGDLRHAASSTPADPHMYVVPIKDVEWVLVEFLPIGVADPDNAPECHSFCGDPQTWDLDGDGEPDVHDTDDDGDGVLDEADDYPYWPGASECDCYPYSYVGLTAKFAQGIERAVLTAHSLLRGLGLTSAGVTLGPTPESEGRVAFVFPAELLPLESRPQPPAGCPDPTDTSVRYVSEYPETCARIRFRCEAGESSFSNQCGCGCTASQRPG